MPRPHTRRAILHTFSALALLGVRPVRAQAALPAYSYPIGLPGRPLGDGFIVRHGYATENTWYNPGWWHTGEDWYLREGDTAGVGVFAAAAGEVVFVGSDYPGRVVIVAQEDGLYAMYGHLAYEPAVAAGQVVTRGELLGTVLARTDGIAPSHLHFELREFFTTPEVNGDAPRYDVGCGFDCPPGPGYWPMDAPEHPAAMGWRNPTHVINGRAFGEGVPAGMEVVVASGASGDVALWSAPGDEAGAEERGSLPLRGGDRYPLLAVATGPEASAGTSAEAYRLWYQLALPDGGEGWVQAARPSPMETGSDGRPSTVDLALLPGIATPT